ncbi:MAG: VCBS repeat-containing protein [Pseudomonadota bacterium]
MRVQFLAAGDLVQLQTISLPDDRVFEDVEARIANLSRDVDDNGRPIDHIAVVEASRSAGAALSVYGIVAGRIEKIASTPHVGRPFRWRAVAGIADFDGDGQSDIAEVVTPHLAGILRFWTLRDGELVEIAEPLPGFSNHRIGEGFITSDVRICDGIAELFLPDLAWQRLVAVRLEDGGKNDLKRIVAHKTKMSPQDAAPDCP